MSTSSSHEVQRNPLPETSDGTSLAELQERLQASNVAAFESIFRRLSPGLYRYLCRLAPSEEAAYDLMQDTFAALWERRSRLSDVSALKSYVYRMARNRALNAKRARKTRRDLASSVRQAVQAPQISPDQELDAKMLGDLLHQWVDELPPRQHEALTLRRFENMSYRSIADVMEISTNTVRNHITLALQKLRDRLRDCRPDLLP